MKKTKSPEIVKRIVQNLIEKGVIGVKYREVAEEALVEELEKEFPVGKREVK